ncbi:hypothetical protein WN51_11918 [Melipona quadrifasciata]|uniref:Uncharacterized protein n=1 Tax=Melipona quadrifasciata TaxID=166423 RepID=A0A0N0U5V2_9HYME|nr:hypothetical protein WN51_11918 [Melipona quadrifasciata]
MASRRFIETGKPILSLHLRPPFAYVPILPSIRISATPGRHLQPPLEMGSSISQVGPSYLSRYDLANQRLSFLFFKRCTRSASFVYHFSLKFPPA